MTQALTNKPASNLGEMIERLQPELERALPKHVSIDRMMRMIMTAFSSDGKLQKCTPKSFMASALAAAQLGLETNTPLGHAYLIPYGAECKLIIGYQGFMELARRSGEITSIYAHVVREGDLFEYRYGLNPDLEHTESRDADRHKKPLTHVYAVAKLAKGDPIFVVLTAREVEERKARSASAKSGSSPWTTDTEAMWDKTAIRALWKWLPKSAEMADAIAIDSAADGLEPFSHTRYAAVSSKVAPSDIGNESEQAEIPT